MVVDEKNNSMKKGSSKKKKGVRMNVNFGPPEEENSAVENAPNIVVQEEDVVTDLVMGKVSFSETDPQLVMAASVFVQELIQKAQLEVETRFNAKELELDVSEEDALLSEKQEHGSKDQTTSQHVDANLRFIREEINKKCRRMYRAFLSCYGKLP